MNAILPFGSRRDLPRGRHLVTPAWLAGPGAGAARLFEAGCGAIDAYAAGHLPGAGYLDTSWFERGPLWNKIPDAELERVLLAHGIRHDTTVVLYGRNVLAAARIAHLLLVAGVADVRLLDGGVAAWQSAGLPLEQGVRRPGPAADDFGTTLPARPGYLVGMDHVRALLRHGRGTLASIRTWDEYVGKTSGYHYIDARGDIPGAVWGRAGADGDVNSMAAYQHADGRMKPAANIRAMWAAAGIHAGRPTVFYCGTGWRASLAFFYAWLMGWDDIAVYDGGWCEWSRDAANPVVCRTGAHEASESACGSDCGPRAPMRFTSSWSMR